jgi:hypothetical protein
MEIPQSQTRFGKVPWVRNWLQTGENGEIVGQFQNNCRSFWKRAIGESCEWYFHLFNGKMCWNYRVSVYDISGYRETDDHFAKLLLTVMMFGIEYNPLRELMLVLLRIMD